MMDSKTLVLEALRDLGQRQAAELRTGVGRRRAAQRVGGCDNVRREPWTKI